MSFWLGTNSGKRIDLENPDPEQIDIRDIVEALPKLCRFNGQINVHYSVAQHSMYVAELVPDNLKYQALLHDATEAYICDIPTPLKRLLGATYKDIEDRLALVIGQKLGVDLVNLHPTVRNADKIMCVSERDALVYIPQSWGPDYDDFVRYPGEIIPRDISPEEFLEMIENFRGCSTV